MVGVLLIVVPATLFMGTAAFLPYPEADTIGRAIALALFIPLLAASIALTHNLYVALFDQRISRKRWTRIDDRLKSLGFRDATSSEVEHTLRLPVSLLAPRTLDVKRGGGIDHVTVGKVRGYEIRSFNVRIRGSGWLDVPALGRQSLDVLSTHSDHAKSKDEGNPYPAHENGHVRARTLQSPHRGALDQPVLCHRPR